MLGVLNDNAACFLGGVILKIMRDITLKADNLVLT